MYVFESFSVGAAQGWRVRAICSSFPSAGSASTSSASPMGPMKNVDPNDPGVDLHSIPGLNMDVAKKLMG